MKNPNIYMPNDFFNAPELEKLLSQMQELPLKDAAVSNDSEPRIDYKTRICKNARIPSDCHELKWIFDIINTYTEEINQQCWKYPLQPELTVIEYNEYEAKDRSHFGWHNDKHDSGPQSKRRISIVIQLSQPKEYAGGELQLRKISGETIVFSKQQGATIVFASDVDHCVAPLTKGKRKSLVAWISIY